MRAFVLGLLVLSLAAPASAAEELVTSQRVVAIGDIHGGYDALIGILRAVGLIDQGNRWSGGDTILVQTGDFLDRGARVRKVMDLLMSLQEQAPAQGGRVVVLIGNHEGMNLVGSSRDVGIEAYAAFAEEGSDARVQAAYKEHARWSRQHAKRLDKPPPELTPEAEAAWLEKHPPGFVEYREALGAEGKYGRWLRSLPTVVRVGDAVFLHGGISPVMMDVSEEAINERVTDEILKLDRCRKQLLEDKLIPSTVEPLDMAEAGFAELKRLSQRYAAAPPVLQERIKTKFEKLRECVDYEDWFLLREDGPVWFRGFAHWSDEEGAGQVEEILTARGARRFVVGHTTQADGRIKERFGGKVFLIDTGMLSSHYRGGQASALEIVDGRFTAVYLDTKIVLWEKGREELVPSVEGRETEGDRTAPDVGHSRSPVEESPPASVAAGF